MPAQNFKAGVATDSIHPLTWSKAIPVADAVFTSEQLCLPASLTSLPIERPNGTAAAISAITRDIHAAGQRARPIFINNGIYAMRRVNPFQAATIITVGNRWWPGLLISWAFDKEAIAIS